MSVDGLTSASEQNARAAAQLATKKGELRQAEQDIAMQKAKAQQEGQNAIQQQVIKNADDVVEISKEGERQADRLRTQQRTQADILNKNSQEHFQQLSADTANRIKQLDSEVARQISDYQRSKMEKLSYIENRGEDPFYHLKTFNPTIAETESDYKVTVNLPSHEAQNLFVTADGRNLKLSLARSYEAKENLEEGRQNRTQSYQSIVETVTLPGIPNMKKIEREYANGQLTLKIAKLS